MNTFRYQDKDIKYIFYDEPIPFFCGYLYVKIISPYFKITLEKTPYGVIYLHGKIIVSTKDFLIKGLLLFEKVLEELQIKELHVYLAEKLLSLEKYLTLTGFSFDTLHRPYKDFYRYKRISSWVSQ